MNYRHAFHAGNFADVHKHTALLALFAHLHRKTTPMFYLDTHAGRGRYDLRSADAARSNEWQTGIGRLTGVAAVSDAVRRYLNSLAPAIGRTRDNAPVSYPGSPLIALAVLRNVDRAVFVERQPAEARALELEIAGRARVSVVCDDGYAALKAWLPPKEKRGLILIDPPYEAAEEFAHAEQAVKAGLARWPTGVFALWYPIKAGSESERLRRSLTASGLRKLLALELCVRPRDSPLALNGSGLIVANPPWQFDEQMKEAMSELHRLLSLEGAGDHRVEWLVPE
jgi:23S rRNA (adenine2030-N6)-methyltransferase